MRLEGTTGRPQQMSSQQQQQPVTVRVMRLSRSQYAASQPALPVPVAGCPLDVLPPAVDTARSIFGDELAVPTVFGRVAVGETLCFLVSLANASPEDVEMLRVRVELQRKDSRPGNPPVVLDTMLDTTTAPLPVMRVGQRLDFACIATLHDAATHALACTVSYEKNGSGDYAPTPPPSSPKGSQRSFSKHFTFTVLRSNNISTRVAPVSLPSAWRAWMVEATVEALVAMNITHISLVPDSARPDIHVYDTHTTALESGDAEEPVSGSKGLRWNLDNFPKHLPRVCDVAGLVPEKGVLRRTFCVALDGTNATLPDVLGKLNVEWRTAYCERGQLQQDVRRCGTTSTADKNSDGKDKKKQKQKQQQQPQQQPQPPRQRLDVSVAQQRDSVALCEPFEIECTVTNRSSQQVSLLVAYNDTKDLTPETVAALTSTLQHSSSAFTTSTAYGTALAVSMALSTADAAQTKSEETEQEEEAAAQARQQAQQKQCGVVVNGSAFDPEPVVLEPGQAHKRVFSLLPVQLGICSLGSLLLYDTHTGIATPCPDIGTVFVRSE